MSASVRLRLRLILNTYRAGRRNGFGRREALEFAFGLDRAARTMGYAVSRLNRDELHRRFGQLHDNVDTAAKRAASDSPAPPEAPLKPEPH